METSGYVEKNAGVYHPTVERSISVVPNTNHGWTVARCSLREQGRRLKTGLVTIQF